MGESLIRGIASSEYTEKSIEEPIDIIRKTGADHYDNLPAGHVDRGETILRY